MKNGNINVDMHGYIARGLPDSVYLDLESQGDLQKLSDPELFLGIHAERFFRLFAG